MTNDKTEQTPEAKKPRRKPPGVSGFVAGGESNSQRAVSQQGQKRTFGTQGPAKPKPQDEGFSREVTDGDEFRNVPARLIRRWDLKDRTEAEMLDDPEYHDLIREVGEEGIISPVTIRPLSKPDEHGHLFEGIVGFKRTSAAKWHDIDVPAQIRNLTDLEALRVQRSENRGKSDVSVWGLGLHYADVVTKEVVKGTNSEIATALGVDRTQFTTYMRIAKDMPKDISDSIKLHHLGYNNLYEMITLIGSKTGSDRDEVIDRIVEHADEIDNNPKKASKVIEKIANSFNPQSKKPVTNEGGVYRSQKGRTYSVKPGKGKVTFTMHEGALEVTSEEELTSVINQFLEKKGLTLEKVEKK